MLFFLQSLSIFSDPVLKIEAFLSSAPKHLKSFTVAAVLLGAGCIILFSIIWVGICQAKNARAGSR